MARLFGMLEMGMKLLIRFVYYGVTECTKISGIVWLN